MEKYNDTKENIIHQAIHLIKSNGFEQVTINDICEASGISKHTFYYYFKSKEDVLMRFFHIPYDLTMKRMSDIISMESPVAQLWHLIEPRILHFSDLGQEIVKRVIIVNVQKDIGTFRRHKDKEAFNQLEKELIAKGQEKKEILNLSNPDHLSFTLRVQLFGLIGFWSMKPDMDLMAEVRTIFKTTLNLADDVEF